MTYAQFVKRMREFRDNVTPTFLPLMSAASASKLTGLSASKSRAHLERMVRENKATRTKYQRVFYTIGGAA